MRCCQALEMGRVDGCSCIRFSGQALRVSSRLRTLANLVQYVLHETNLESRKWIFLEAHRISMGNSASQVEGDPIMAEEGVKRMSKRKVADDDVNWLGHDLEKALEKRRKLEEDEPYNDAGVRQKAKEIGIEKAMSSSVSEVSKV